MGNAGIFDYGAPLVETPTDRLEPAFDELFAVNVKGYLLDQAPSRPAWRGPESPSAPDAHNHRSIAGDSDLAEAVKILAWAHQSLSWTRQRQANQVRAAGVLPGGSELLR